MSQILICELIAYVHICNALKICAVYCLSYTSIKKIKMKEWEKKMEWSKEGVEKRKVGITWCILKLLLGSGTFHFYYIPLSKANHVANLMSMAMDELPCQGSDSEYFE